MEKRKGSSGDTSGTVEKKTKYNQTVAFDQDIKGREQKHLTDHGDSAGPSRQSDQVDDWTNFRYVSMPRERNWHDHTVFYTHWLNKLDYKDDHYAEFDTVIHATSFENAEKIFENGELKLQIVKDSSITNPKVKFYKTTSDKNPVQFQCLHPMVRTDVVWYGPYIKDDLKKNNMSINRYGNVVFSMKSLYGFDGIVRESGDFRYYFVEVVDYVKESACRILITKNRYPELLEYNPYEKGGPWYIDTCGKHKYLFSIKNASGNYVRNSLEFMREEEEPFRSMWLANHNISFIECWNPRRGVSVSNLRQDGYRLALGLLAYKLNIEDNLPLQQWSYIEKEGQPLLSYFEQTVKPLLEKNEKRDSAAENDGPSALDSECEERYRKLEQQINMKVIDIRTFVIRFLISHKMSFLSKSFDLNCFWRRPYSPHLNGFLETLILLTQEKLVHIFPDNSAQRKLAVENLASHELYKSVLVRTKKNWTHFSYFIEHYSSLETNNSGYVRHWLPEDLKTLLPEDFHVVSDEGNNYRKFDVLVKSPDEKCYMILSNERDKPKPELHLIDDPSVANIKSELYDNGLQRLNERLVHPLSRAMIYRYRADMKDNLKNECERIGKYGKDVFVMESVYGNEGIIRHREDFSYYLLEIVDFQDKSVCRVLATYRNEYPALLKIDVYSKETLLYFSEKNWYLSRIRNYEGRMVKTEIEILREVRDVGCQIPNWESNHCSVRQLISKTRKN